MLFSVFIPPGYPVQMYIFVCAISLQDITACFQQCWITGCRSVADGTAGWLGHRISRNEGSSRCAVEAYHRVNLGKGRQ